MVKLRDHEGEAIFRGERKSEVERESLREGGKVERGRGERIPMVLEEEEWVDGVIIYTEEGWVHWWCV